MADQVVTVSVPVLTIYPSSSSPAAPVASSSSPAAAPSAAGGISGAATQSQAPDPDHEYDSAPLMWHVDIFLLGLVFLIILLRAPRVLARFGRPSQWFKNGHFLNSATPQRLVARQPPQQFQQGAGTPPYDQSGEPKPDAMSNEDHTIATHEYWYNKTNEILPHGPSPNYPIHVTYCPAMFRSMIKVLSWRPTPGYSFAQLSICAIWFGVTLYTAIFKSPGPFTDAARWGWIAGAQLPFVFAFASKNNVLSAMMGLGYEKLNFIHRAVGTAVVWSVNIHSIGYFYKWALAGTFQASLARPANMWGLLATVAINGLWLFSGPWMRERMYNVFICTHVISFSVLLPAAYQHKAAMVPYIYASLAVYTLDHVLRMIKTRVHTATLLPLNELGATRVEIRGVNAGWRAGQHVRIRVLSSGMGWFGWSESHPFTVANAAGGDEGMVLICKKAGGWTNKLFDLAKASEHEVRRATMYGSAIMSDTKVKVWVEGPYGGPGPCELAAYSAAMFICGGSGISLGLAGIEELVRKDARGESRVKAIELVWMARDPSQLIPVLPKLMSLQQESLYTPIRLSIFYTRAAIGKFPFPEDYFMDPAKLNLSPGRPKIGKILESLVGRTIPPGAAPTKEKAQEDNCGVIVGVCGPRSLADDVSKEVNKLDTTRRDQIGGVEIYEEVFGW